MNTSERFFTNCVIFALFSVCNLNLKWVVFEITFWEILMGNFLFIFELLRIKARIYKIYHSDLFKLIMINHIDTNNMSAKCEPLYRDTLKFSFLIILNCLKNYFTIQVNYYILLTNFSIISSKSYKYTRSMLMWWDDHCYIVVKQLMRENLHDFRGKKFGITLLVFILK